MASRYVWAAAAVVLLVLLAVFYFSPIPSPVTPSTAPAPVTLSDAQAVQYGGQPAVWAMAQGPLPDAFNATGQMQLDALDQPPIRRVVLLSGPWSGATRLPVFETALISALRPAGWSVEMSNLSSLAPSTEGRFIILPSGAWPSSLLSQWNASLSQSDVLVYIGVRDNLTLDDAGGVNEGGVPSVLLAGGPPIPGLSDSSTLIAPNSEAVWEISRTLDEFSDPDALAHSLASAFFQSDPAHLLAHTQTPYSSSRWSSVLPLSNSNAPSMAWIRLRLYDSQGQLLRLWDRPLSPSDGIIDAPAQALPGDGTALQIRLRPNLSQSENISYQLNLYSPDGRLWKTMALGGSMMASPNAPPNPNSSRVASNHSTDNLSAPNSSLSAPPSSAASALALQGYIFPANLSSSQNTTNTSSVHLSSPLASPAVNLSPDNLSTAWVGSQIISDWPGPGLVRLEVADQFGRAYAQAIVDIPNLSVQSLDGGGFTRRFLLLRDGQPLNATDVEVSRDNSSGPPLSLPLSDGIVSVSSSWSAGPHVLQFEAGGIPFHYGWEEPAGGAWGVFWSIGLPGLLVAAALYLLLRPRARPSYYLRVPQWPDLALPRLQKNPDEMMRVLRAAAMRVQGKPNHLTSFPPVALQSADLVSILQHPPDHSKPILISPESAEEALAQLERSGHLVRWKNYYAPLSVARAASKNAAPSNGVRHLALERMLRDHLMENGIRLPVRPFASGLWRDSSGHSWVIWQQQSIQTISRLRPTHLLFADEKERASFTKTLSASGTPAASALQLSIELGRLRLVLVGAPLS